MSQPPNRIATTFAPRAFAMMMDDNVVTKSPLDKKQYRHMKLTNGLSLLLISDPEIKIDAADEHSRKRARSDDDDEDEDGEDESEDEDDADEDEDSGDSEGDEGEEEEPKKKKKHEVQKKAAAAM